MEPGRTFDRLSPAERRIRIRERELTEMACIRMDLRDRGNYLIRGEYRKWLEDRLAELEEKYGKA